MSTNPLDEPSLPTPRPSSPTSVPDTGKTNQPQEQHNPPLSIEGAPASEPVETVEEVTTLDLGEGNVVKLDKLGPMIINSDGTLSRIQNWQDLHPIEQERTVRLLVKKRNLVRLQKLDRENNKAADGEEPVSALK